MCPCWPGSEWGWGVGRNHTGLKFPLLARRGRRRGGPQGKGRVGGRTENSSRGLHRGGRCTAQKLPLLSAQCEPTASALSNGQGAGHRPPRFSEVAGILAKEVSAQAQPPHRQHLEPHLSLHPAWSLPQVPVGWGGRGILVGSRDRLGGRRREREEIPNFWQVLKRSQTFPSCPWFGNLTSLGTPLGEDLDGFWSVLGFLG